MARSFAVACWFLGCLAATLLVVGLLAVPDQVFGDSGGDGGLTVYCDPSCNIDCMKPGGPCPGSCKTTGICTGCYCDLETSLGVCVCKM